MNFTEDEQRTDFLQDIQGSVVDKDDQLQNDFIIIIVKKKVKGENFIIYLKEDIFAYHDTLSDLSFMFSDGSMLYILHNGRTKISSFCNNFGDIYFITYIISNKKMF